MLLEVSERDSSFFDEIDEKNIMSEVKSGLQSNRSNKSAIGGHLKKEETRVVDEKMEEVQTELSFYAIEEFQSIADLKPL